MVVVDFFVDFDIKFKFVVGYSLGEIVVLYVVGVFSYENVICGLFFCGWYLKVVKKFNVMFGFMFVMGYSEQVVFQIIKVVNLGLDKGCVAVVCVNSFNSVILFGDEFVIDII